MNILVVGSGGREHAIVLKCQESDNVGQVYCAPGNGGTDKVATNVDIGVEQLPELLAFVKSSRIDLCIVGPEAPLVLGLSDLLRENGCKVVGPSAAAARIEGSKDFAKEFMTKYSIPTAKHQTFSGEQLEEALAYCEKQALPIVLKADGLAGGKGVVICEDIESTRATLSSMLSGDSFGKAGRRVVVEEFMEGEEASVFLVCDGKEYVVLSPAQDHKRVGENDTGPNTGGMGAYAPAPVMTSALMKEVDERISKPSIEGMQKEGHPFNGFLYIGLMITSTGPKVVEYNCRLGDPETQVVLPLIESDFLDLMNRVADGRVKGYDLDLSSDYAACVVLASGGYPASYEKGHEIKGLDKEFNSDTLVYQAGTKRNEDGSYSTSGGRVLAVTGRGGELSEAIDKAYAGIERIGFKDSFYRGDIGQKGLKRLE